MSEPTNPPAFDPRRLADLASRLGARPAPTAPQSGAPQSAAPQSAGDQSADAQPAGEQSAGAQSASAQPGGAGDAAGHVQIDAVLAELKRAEQLPPDQQIAVYEAVHRTLQETLRSIEQS